MTETYMSKEFRKTLCQFCDYQLLKYKNKINANARNSQEHISRAQCNNWVIKERVYLDYSQFPYCCLPKTLAEHLSIESEKKFDL